MKRIVFLPFIFLLLKPIYTQGFLRSYNVYANTYGGGIVELADGSIISSATNIDTVWSPLFNDSIVAEVLTLYKVDQNGEPIWLKNYSLNTACAYGGAFTLTPESTLVFVSVAPRDVSIGNPEVLVFKLDLDGNVLWSKVYGAFGNEYSFSVTADANAIYILGFSDSHLPGAGDAYLLKTDLDGNLIWSNVYPINALTEYLSNLHLDASSNTYSTGYVNGGAGQSIGTLVLKTNSGGVLQYMKEIYEVDTLIYNNYSSSWLTNDNHVLIIGSRSKLINPLTSTYTSGIYLYKLTSGGSMVYSKFITNFLDTISNFQPLLIREKPNGDYLIFSRAYTFSTTGYSDCFLLIELEPNGTFITSKKISSSKFNILPQTCKLSNDNNFWLMNCIDFNVYGSCILKFDTDYNIDCGAQENINLLVQNISPFITDFNETTPIGSDTLTPIITNPKQLKSSIFCYTSIDELIFPNVFTPNGDGVNDYYYFEFENFENVTFSIYDRWGVLLYEAHQSPISWDGKNLNNALCSEGTYYYVFTGLDKLNKMQGKAGFLMLLY